MTSKSPQAHRGWNKKRRHDTDPDENDNSTPLSVTRSRKPSSNQQGSRQSQGVPQDTDLLIQEVQPLMVEGTDLFRRFHEIVHQKGMQTSRKYELIHTELRKVLGLQEKAQLQIAELKEEAQFEIATSQFEIATLKRRCHSLHEALHGARSVLQNDTEVLRLKFCRDLNENVEAAVNSGYEGERGLHKRLKQMTDGEILSRVLSLYESSRTLTGELQKMSHEYKSFMKLKQAGASGHKLQKTSHEQNRGSLLALVEGNGDGHFTANSGSYTDDSATPNLLANVFTDTKAAVTWFQKELIKAFKVGQDKTWDLPKPDQIVFARENHLGFYLKSVLNEIFFEGFENESFNTSHGVSRFLHPSLRQTKFYEYYQNNTGDINDPQLGEFCEVKRSSLWEKFPLYNKNERKVCCFEELGGCELGLQLALSFKAAVKSVWLLHKLAFSFEPPASIFRVEKGADVDPTYMDAIVKLEDDPRFVSKVGFMVTPGLRLRKTVMRSEVYLSGATTTPDYSPDGERSFQVARQVGGSADRDKEMLYSVKLNEVLIQLQNCCRSS